MSVPPEVKSIQEIREWVSKLADGDLLKQAQRFYTWHRESLLHYSCIFVELETRGFEFEQASKAMQNVYREIASGKLSVDVYLRFRGSKYLDLIAKLEAAKQQEVLGKSDDEVRRIFTGQTPPLDPPPPEPVLTHQRSSTTQVFVPRVPAAVFHFDEAGKVGTPRQVADYCLQMLLANPKPLGVLAHVLGDLERIPEHQQGLRKLLRTLLAETAAA